MADAARKADTFKKIQLGGLVIKAGLGDLAPAVLLGALIDAARGLDDPLRRADLEARYRGLGDEGFGGRSR